MSKKYKNLQKVNIFKPIRLTTVQVTIGISNLEIFLGSKDKRINSAAFLSRKGFLVGLKIFDLKYLVLLGTEAAAGGVL